MSIRLSKMSLRIFPVLGLVMLFLIFPDRLPAKKPGKTLHIAFNQDFNGNYDPAEGDHFSFSPLFFNIYSTLFRLDGGLKPYPFLLSSSEKSGNIVLLNIRKDAAFSDGETITAEDVARSLDVKPTGFRQSSEAYTIAGGPAFSYRPCGASS